MPNLFELDFDFPPLPFRSRGTGKMGDVVPRDETQPGVPQVFATINKLPDELVVEILNYLPGIDLSSLQLATLVSLSSTSRRFHRLVSAKLYATYNSFYCEPYLFLRTITSNSYLAGLVKTVNLKYGNLQSRRRTRYIATAQDKKTVKEGLKALLPGDWKYWATGCNTDYILPEFLHTAILMHIPNITTLITRDGSIGTNGSSKAHRWPDLLKAVHENRPFGKMHHFRHLHTLQFDNDGLTLPSLKPIFRTPSLRMLRINELVEPVQGPERAEFYSSFYPKSSNNLNELHLGRSFVQNDILALLISTPRRLTTLNYEITRNYLTWSTQEEELGTTTLVAAIKHQKKSLEKLFIMAESEIKDHFFGLFDLWEGVQDFSSLKHLSCPLGTIVSGEQDEPVLRKKLPPSLLTFHTTIRHEDEGDVAGLRALEQMAMESSDEASLPTVIRITVENPVGPWLRYDWARLIRPFSLTTVQMVIEGGQPMEFWSSSRWRQMSVMSDDVSSESSGEVSLYSDGGGV